MLEEARELIGSPAAFELGRRPHSSRSPVLGSRVIDPARVLHARRSAPRPFGGVEAMVLRSLSSPAAISGLERPLHAELVRT